MTWLEKFTFNHQKEVKPMLKIGIIGSGSWGTALAKILTDNQHAINWYVYNPKSVDHLKAYGHNPEYLSSVGFSQELISPTDDLNWVVAHSDILLLVTPSAFLSNLLSHIEVDLSNKIIFSAVKGIIPESGLIVGEHLQKHHQIALDAIGVITGPCHAEEVALERLSYLTIAATKPENAQLMAAMLGNRYIRATLSDDIIGTEYAAVLKNIYAIAAGIAHGLGYGDNFQAVLMSNAIREMERFIHLVFEMNRDINNSAYLGDLLVTGYSTFSRNRQLGNMLGKGYRIQSALSEMNMIAEGYYAVKSAYQMMSTELKLDDFPIITAVYEVTYDKKSAKAVFEALTKRLD